jgi:toluene monooxygenase system protein D
MSDDVEAIIMAIEDDNPDKELEVTDRGAYVRIQGEQELKVTRESIQRYVGRDFAMRELETMLSAFSGRINTTSDEIVWTYKRKEKPLS